MANWMSINNRWYALPHDPVKASTAVKNVKDNLKYHGGAATNAQIYTQIENADSTWKCYEQKWDKKEYDH